MRLRMDGEGDAPATGRAPNPDAPTSRGNLYIHISVAADPKFTRSGSDILYTASIPITTAILGGEVRIPTLDGDVNVKVATGTGAGDRITLAGQGMKILGRGAKQGDLKVEFKVNMPKYLNANQRTILEMLADEMGDKTAKRIMNVSRTQSEPGSPPTPSETHQNEGFLKSLWHKLSDHAAHRDEKPLSKETTPKDEDNEDLKKP